MKIVDPFSKRSLKSIRESEACFCTACGKYFIIKKDQIADPCMCNLMTRIAVGTEDERKQILIRHYMKEGK